MKSTKRRHLAIASALAVLLSMAGLAGCNDDSSPQPAPTTQGASPG
ncbi:hypothetical protein [Streptomyces violascens]|nr:hypothetical protein [Streptomyces violascens]